MEIYNEFTFDSAHYLPNLPEGHKCRRLHGHTYTIRIFVKGKVDKILGWVIDFGDIEKVSRPIIDELDHMLLNDIDGLENPTCENIARWVWQRLKISIPGLSKVIVKESTSAGCIYEG